MSACLAPNAAFADAQFGIETFIVRGSHVESSGSVTDTLVAPVFHVSAGTKRLQFVADGIPTFGINSVPNSPSLPAVTDLGYVDAAARGAIDARSRFWLGLGGLIVNQRTQLPASSSFLYRTESSRVAGVRYESIVRLPVRRDTFVLQIAVHPNLFGTLFLSNCRFCFQKEFSVTEHGALTDESAMYELHRSRSVWDIGVRFINYSAAYVRSHAFADRNVGGGITLRYSFEVGR